MATSITLLAKKKEKRPATDEAASAGGTQGEDGGGDGEEEEEDGDKKYPGIVAWIGTQGLDCQLPQIERKLLRDVATSGMCVSEVKVSNVNILII